MPDPFCFLTVADTQNVYRIANVVRMADYIQADERIDDSGKIRRSYPKLSLGKIAVKNGCHFSPSKGKQERYICCAGKGIKRIKDRVTDAKSVGQVRRYCHIERNASYDKAILCIDNDDAVGLLSPMETGKIGGSETLAADDDISQIALDSELKIQQAQFKMLSGCHCLDNFVVHVERTIQQDAGVDENDAIIHHDYFAAEHRNGGIIGACKPAVGPDDNFRVPTCNHDGSSGDYLSSSQMRNDKKDKKTWISYSTPKGLMSFPIGDKDVDVTFDEANHWFHLFGDSCRSHYWPVTIEY